jgi:sulfite reductase (NADPH) hemoprotein beta-component
VADTFPHVEFRLTANQNLIVANISDADRHAVAMLLSAYGVKTEKQASVLHAASMACPALPTCGLALAESERILPGLVDRFEKMLAEAGLGGEEIIIRVTGCPNGCARPYMAEIGLVGKSPGRYQVWLGGDVTGTRLNRLWKDVLKEPDLETEFRPVFTRFAQERNPGERFGDWCQRALLNEAPKG